MKKEIRTFTHDEEIYLVHYTQSIVFDAVQSNLKPDKVSFEETSRILLRKWGRLLAYPELILQERPKKKPKTRTHLKIQEKELLFKILGNKCPEMQALNDEELLAELFRQLQNYS